MKKVYMDHEIIILSDKELTENTQGELLFSDGSYVDIASRTIKNKGFGDILIKDLPQWPNMISVMSEQHEFQGIGHLTVRGGKNNIVILPNEEENCIVSLGGSDGFVSRSFVEQHGDGLYISTPKSNNDIQISVGDIWINGKRMPLKLEEDFGYIEVKVNNLQSLSIDSRGTGELFSEVPIQKLYAEIQGLTSLDLAEVDQAEINISGSGSVGIEILSDALIGEISGSGDIDIYSGNPDSIDMSISGSGSLSAGITVNNATLVLSGSGSIFVSHVIGESIEQKIGSGSIRVMKRG